MRTAKKGKKKYKKKILAIVATTLTPPRQHQNSSFSKSDVFKKEIVYKHRHRSIIDLRFALEKVRVHKTMPSTKPLPGTTN
jgi:hypothetical protein